MYKVEIIIGNNRESFDNIPYDLAMIIRILVDNKKKFKKNTNLAESAIIEGQKLRQIRKEKNLKQSTVASELNVSQPLISKMEQGHRPSEAIQQKIINYYEIEENTINFKVMITKEELESKEFFKKL